MEWVISKINDEMTELSRAARSVSDATIREIDMVSQAIEKLAHQTIEQPLKHEAKRS